MQIKLLNENLVQFQLLKAVVVMFADFAHCELNQVGEDFLPGL